MEIINSFFYSKGTKCAGWLYMPQASDSLPPPVVVMAHGFGAESSFKLPAFAEKFVQKGMAVFLFDYRNFGSSEGEPRNLVSPSRHVRDWLAAVEHVRTLEEVDADRIALWGTSFSGGHVLVVAAIDKGISAVVSQIPFVDGIAALFSYSPGYIFKATANGLRDLLSSIIFKKRHYVKIVGEPRSFAVLNTPESLPGYMGIVPEETSWQNRCPAKALLEIPAYRPAKYAPRINCPVLVVYGEKDSLIAAGDVRKTVQRIKDVKEAPLPTGHFDIYYSEMFTKVAEIEAEFLQEELQT